MCMRVCENESECVSVSVCDDHIYTQCKYGIFGSKFFKCTVI